jgi:hypothetical protein
MTAEAITTAQHRNLGLTTIRTTSKTGFRGTLLSRSACNTKRRS